MKISLFFMFLSQSTEILLSLLILVCCFLKRKRSGVSEVKQEALQVLGEGEDLLDQANQLSDNINKEIEVLKST